MHLHTNELTVPNSIDELIAKEKMEKEICFSLFDGCYEEDLVLITARPQKLGIEGV